MRLVDDDHVIQTLSSDRADQAFDVWILPRTRRRGNDLGDAEADQSSAEDVAENAVAVTVQLAGRRVVRKGLDLSVAKTASWRTVANRVVLDPCPPPFRVGVCQPVLRQYWIDIICGGRLSETLPFSCPFGATRSGKRQQRAAQSECR